MSTLFTIPSYFLTQNIKFFLPCSQVIWAWCGGKQYNSTIGKRKKMANSLCRLFQSQETTFSSAFLLSHYTSNISYREEMSVNAQTLKLLAQSGFVISSTFLLSLATYRLKVLTGTCLICKGACT